MGILINTGFDVGSSSPVDNRTLKDTTDERDELVNEGKVYENLKVYCKDTKKEYRWTGTEWEIVGSGSGDLTDYQNKTDDTLTTTDKTVVGAINEVNGNSLDTVGFSADYKNIILNRKNGLNPYIIPISSIINNASLTELKDVDSTDIGNGKTLVYDSSTQKHKYVNTIGTDELVKMDGTTEAKYLGDLLDKSTIVNENGILKVKKLDGQEVTITEINYLKGLTMNVMDLVNAFANGGVKVLSTPLNTASELDTMDRTSFIDGISYIVYVLADENHTGAKTTYLVDKTNTTFFGNADSQRNFTTNPLDLASEVTGKLGVSNIDVDNLWKLLTIDDTYKTLTTDNNIFGTHGAKAMYDELVTAIGSKANQTDLDAHTGDTTIHITQDEKDKLVTTDDITITIDKSSTDTQVPSAKAIETRVNKVINGTLYANKDLNLITESGLYMCAGGNRYGATYNFPVADDGYLQHIAYPESGYCVQTFFQNGIWHEQLNMYIRNQVGGTWSEWKRACITSVADVSETDIAYTLPTSIVPYGDGTNFTIKCVVKNGIANVVFAWMLSSTEAITKWTTIASTLPKPLIQQRGFILAEKAIDSRIQFSIKTSGELELYIAEAITTAGWFKGTITYPVAES